MLPRVLTVALLLGLFVVVMPELVEVVLSGLLEVTLSGLLGEIRSGLLVIPLIGVVEKVDCFSVEAAEETTTRTVIYSIAPTSGRVHFIFKVS